VLKQRLITAAILVPLFLWSVLSLPTNTVAVLFVLVVAVGAWEWSALTGLQSYTFRTGYIAAVIAIMVVVGRFMGANLLIYSILSLAVVWWIAALIWINQAESQPEISCGTGGNPDWKMLLLGIVVLVPTWIALILLHRNGTAGIYLMLTLFAIVWGADSGAYFAGRRWGRRKLAPHISPGKTWEGVTGGLAVVVIVMIIAAWLMGYGWSNLLSFVLLGIVTAMFSIVGDLLESLMKRRCGVKDSGQILPGHGGVLDRIDSLTAAAPVFTLGLLLQGISL